MLSKLLVSPGFWPLKDLDLRKLNKLSQGQVRYLDKRSKKYFFLIGRYQLDVHANGFSKKMWSYDVL